MKQIMGKYFWLWVLLLLVVANGWSCYGCWEGERTALLELEASMMSPNGNKLWGHYNESGFLDCCSWDGVKCNITTRQVIELKLKGAREGLWDGWRFNVSLFLPFKWLEVLSLRDNNVIGWTENEGFDKLSVLKNLKVLNLRENHLHLNVLSDFCWISSLEVLKVGGSSFNIQTNHSKNKDSGKCPGLSNIRELWLVDSGINDISVLSALGLGTRTGLKKLEKLYLYSNSFNSSVFSSLKVFPSLRRLDLSENEINENIEMNDVIALSNLDFLDLQMNNFESFVTTKGSKRMSSLRILRLGMSDSSASNVLQSVKSFSSLQSLSYIDGDLTAPATTYALRNLSTLKFLYLDGSGLNDNFLASIGQMTSLEVLDMGFGNNNGTLPNQGWCELKNLQELALTMNNFEGRLPSCLGNLTSLRWLNLDGNYFTGNIATSPVRLLTSIEYLVISYNQFELPLSFKQFVNHSKLIFLNVGGNTITTDHTKFQNWIPKFQLQYLKIAGTEKQLQKLPSFLHHQYDLRILDIYENQLLGNFPTWLLENNTRLAGLYARDNAFTGPLKLPSSCLLHLEAIDVSNNKLNGHIPANISSSFPKLRLLNMSQNFLEGPIPTDIGSYRLVKLDLSHNLLSGGVPSNLAVSSPKLFYLRLSNNKLKGKIFSEHVIPVGLAFLYLTGNEFEGSLPASIFLTTLIVLDASNNNFSGEIPRWIRDSTSLLQLDMSKNHLEGSIPYEICNLKHVEVLALSENRLSGSVPSCVSSLPLQHIYLHKNKLDGEIEHVFSNMSSLVTLDLGYNSFTGKIPHFMDTVSNLTFLLLNNNQLKGEISAQLCLQKTLSIMDLSFNMLYGPIPHCLGNFKQAKNTAKIRSTYLTETSKGSFLNFLSWISSTRHYHIQFGILSDYFLMDVETKVQFSTKKNTYSYKGTILIYMSGIDLSSNSLTGEIPTELGNMSKLNALNLSHNHLVGRIPETFSNLHAIESLDLSYNNLNGSIPVGLLELHYLEIFSVADNNLSGAVPQFKAQFSTFDKSSYEGNPFLCGYPLDNDCSHTKSWNTSMNIGSEESGFVDTESFYMGFVVSYGAILLGIAAALCINSHWRKEWFRLVEALMLTSYYFLLDNVVKPFKSRWWRNFW